MKDTRRYYQRCGHCQYRAFEFKFNPNGKQVGTDDIIYANEGYKPFQCQHCGQEVRKQDFGHDRLIAREATGYTKYKGATPIHWQWYRNNTDQYNALVDKSLTHFDGLKGSVLDIGFGDGLIASLLMARGFKVIGIEPEKDGIEAAKKMMPDMPRVCLVRLEDYITGDMIPVDYMYSMNTIEHVDDYSAFAAVMSSVKNFAIVITDNAINKNGERRKSKEMHSHEFSYDELVEVFRDFKTEKIDTGNGSFIGIKIYAK